MQIVYGGFELDVPGEIAEECRGALAQRNSGRVRISGSVFQYNEGGAVGGAVFVWSDVDLGIVGCVFSDNLVISTDSNLGIGGAVASNKSPVSVAESTFSNNRAIFSGGAIGAYSWYF